jgi:hypothetical protein
MHSFTVPDVPEPPHNVFHVHVPAALLWKLASLNGAEY